MVETELDFSSLERVEVPVKVGDKSYTLREASGGAAVQYRNASAGMFTFGPDGRATSIKDPANLEPLLIHLCLFDEKGEHVPQSVIKGWPARVQKAVFLKAKEISDVAESTPERVLLERALSVEGSPFSLAQLREWVGSIEDQTTYRPLKVWLATDKETASKNGQGGMMDGSD